MGAGAQGLGGVLGEDAAFAHEEQLVAALGLVHDVGGDEDRGAAGGGDVVEEVPQVAAQDGVESDGGFVEDQELGGAEQGDGEGDAAALAAGEVAGEGAGAGGEVDVGDGAVHGVGAAGGGGPAGVEDRGEVVEVLADGEVVVDGGRLGDVADAGAQVGVAGGAAEDVEGAGDVGLRADDGAQEGGFAAAGGAEEAGDAAAGDVEGDVGDDGAGGAAGAAADGQAVRVHGGRVSVDLLIHHVMNNAPGGARASITGKEADARSEPRGRARYFLRLGRRAAGLPVRVLRRRS